MSPMRWVAVVLCVAVLVGCLLALILSDPGDPPEYGR